jgi:hypothetical protein
MRGVHVSGGLRLFVAILGALGIVRAALLAWR